MESLDLRWSRRGWLRAVGGASVGIPMGLGWGGIAGGSGVEGGVSSPGGAGFGRARSVILLWMLGGPPQHETWDPKPDAPAEFRGPFGSIATSVPGLRVGELMPLTASRVDKVTILRAVTTGDHAHTSSGYHMLTGRVYFLGKNRESMPPSAMDAPCVGALAGRYGKGSGGGALPAAVTLPEIIYNNPKVDWPGQNAGFLGRAHDPWLAELDPGTSAPTLAHPAGVDPSRAEARRGLLSRLDGARWALEETAEHDRNAGRAFEMLGDPRARAAFDLDRESSATRDRYGRDRWGQSFLLARRLVEAGVRFVQVNWARDEGANGGNPAWDIHNDGANRLKSFLMPTMDRAYSALLDDLAARGLLEETLVLWAGEFGRTPRMDEGGSRHHWGTVFSVAVAGAGIGGGRAIGASDRLGATPKDRPVEPGDLAATTLHALGIPPTLEYRDPLDRPFPLASGRVLSELW